MNIEQQRKAFNDWYGIKPKGWFEAVRYNTAWRAWLAAQQQEGYVLVPVEPTERMLDCAYSSISDNLHYADLENIYRAMTQEAQE